MEAELRLAVAGSQRRRLEKNYCIMSSSEAKKVNPFFLCTKLRSYKHMRSILYSSLVRDIYMYMYLHFLQWCLFLQERVVTEIFSMAMTERNQQALCQVSGF